MGLYFKNETSSPVWVTYAYYSPGCEGGVNWSKKGWYHVLPGHTAKVWSGWAGGDKFFSLPRTTSDTIGPVRFSPLCLGMRSIGAGTLQATMEKL